MKNVASFLYPAVRLSQFDDVVPFEDRFLK